MKSVLQSLQNEPCRVWDISENEKTNFSSYCHLQRYFPALDIFKIPESALSLKNLELPSKYQIDTWLSKHEEQDKVWKISRKSIDSEKLEEGNAFVKVVHLLDPIGMIKEKYVCPEHPLIPQSEKTWKNTLLKLHSHNNQAYVDAVANFVLSRFRELDLTPHCGLYYGSLTGISQLYKFNISNEYDSYRQCRWFWKGMKSHSARLTVGRGENDIEEIPNFQDIYKEITTCPFNEEDEELVTELDLDIGPITDLDAEISDVESIESFTFDNIEENADNVKDIFEINRKIINKRNSVKSNHSSTTESTEESDNDSNDEDEDGSDDIDSDDDIKLDLDIYLEIPNMPVIMIVQEAQEGVMDDLLDEDKIDGHERGTQGWESRWTAWIFQVIAALTFLQSAICFTHNDLHSNNIIWRKTDKKFLYYKANDGTIWRVPTFGKIFSIIDFGRSIFRLGSHLWVSDDHWPDQDAGEQYNFGPFFDHTKPKNKPNPSFDLCRLSVSLLDGLFNDTPPKKKGKAVPIMSEEGSWKVYETNSPLYNLLWSWTINDAGQTVYEDKDGDEKYVGFDLYIRIAHDVHNALPKEQIHKPIFQQFKWKQKVAQDETIYSLGV
jgi:hypothetical protein